MNRQTTFPDIADAGPSHTAKRDSFLRQMYAAMPWPSPSPA